MYHNIVLDKEENYSYAVEVHIPVVSGIELKMCDYSSVYIQRWIRNTYSGTRLGPAKNEWEIFSQDRGPSIDGAVNLKASFVLKTVRSSLDTCFEDVTHRINPSFYDHSWQWYFGFRPLPTWVLCLSNISSRLDFKPFQENLPAIFTDQEWDSLRLACLDWGRMRSWYEDQSVLSLSIRTTLSMEQIFKVSLFAACVSSALQSG